eukprot:gene11653-13762_t
MANEGLNILETSSVVESKGHLEVPCELLKDVQVTTAGEAADVMTALVLSECVYQESSSDGLRRVLNGTQSGRYEASSDGVDCGFGQDRYLVAAGGEALYLAFMGSKHARDWLTDANALQARSSDYKALVGVKARGYSPGHKAGRGGLRWTLGGLDGGPVEHHVVCEGHIEVAAIGRSGVSGASCCAAIPSEVGPAWDRIRDGAVAVIATLKLLEQLGDIGP